MNFDYRGRPAIGWHLSLDCLGDLSELGVESIALNPRLNAECAKSAEAWSHFKLHTTEIGSRASFTVPGKDLTVD
jgi:hypothetical protein